MDSHFTSHLGTLYVRMFIPEAQSLKDKRRVLRRLKDRVHNGFNVSLAELDGLDRWQTATLGFAMLGNDQRYIDAAFQKLLTLIDSYQAVDVCEQWVEWR